MSNKIYFVVEKPDHDASSFPLAAFRSRELAERFSSAFSDDLVVEETALDRYAGPAQAGESFYIATFTIDPPELEAIKLGSVYAFMLHDIGQPETWRRKVWPSRLCVPVFAETKARATVLAQAKFADWLKSPTEAI